MQRQLAALDEERDADMEQRYASLDGMRGVGDSRARLRLRVRVRVRVRVERW